MKQIIFVFLIVISVGIIRAAESAEDKSEFRISKAVLQDKIKGGWLGQDSRGLYRRPYRIQSRRQNVHGQTEFLAVF